MGEGGLPTGNPPPPQQGPVVPTDSGDSQPVTQSTPFREFPGSPVVRTPRFHRRGPGFNPWSGN